jgi:AraC-like DNA-binding protein
LFTLIAGAGRMAYYQEIKLTKPYIIQRRIGKALRHEHHFHHLLEVGIVVKNKVRYQFGQNDYFGEAGDVFLCRPFEAHWSYITDPEHPYHSVLIYFTPSIVRSIPLGYRLLAPFYSMEMSSPVIPRDTPYAKAICRLAEEALEAEENKSIAWESTKYVRFLDILIQIYTYFEQTCRPVQTDETEQINEDMLKIISHILTHITEDFSIDELMESFKLKKTSFFQKFRLLTGLSPNHFVNRIRLQIAADLLLYSDMSITELALESGFPSLSTFNKQFKQYYSMTPVEFRKSEPDRTGSGIFIEH